MEEFVVSDLSDSEYIFSAAILDDQGFIKTSNPEDSKTKERLAKFAEVLYASDDFEKTTIITEHRILVIHRLVRNFTLVVECSTDSNLGMIRDEVADAVTRLDTYFNSTSR
tara:strand:- start:3357 stop:3689 length:333 start_codon:yes stop_codon:yes gene_type:complete